MCCCPCYGRDGAYAIVECVFSGIGSYLNGLDGGETERGDLGGYLFDEDLVAGESCCPVLVVELDEFLGEAGDEFRVDRVDDGRVCRRHARSAPKVTSVRTSRQEIYSAYYNLWLFVSRAVKVACIPTPYCRNYVREAY